MSSPSEESQPESRRHRSGLPGSVVLLGLLLFVAAGIAGLWFAYAKLVDYERRAALHVPAGARLAARVDLEQVVLFEPVRRHVFPVLNRHLTGNEGLAQLEATTGIDLGSELREILFVQPASEEAWLLAVGGLFPTTGVIEGLTELLEARGIAGCSLQHARLACPSQSFFAEQAADGIVLFSSDPALLVAAREPTDEYQRLGLRLDGAAGFGVEGAWLRQVGHIASSPWLAPFASRLAPLADVESASGHVDLGTDTTVTVQLRPLAGTDLQALAPGIEQMLGTVAELLSLARHQEQAGERTMLENAAVVARADGTVEILAPWARQDIDRAARSLADWLTSWAEARQEETNQQ